MEFLNIFTFLILNIPLLKKLLPYFILKCKSYYTIYFFYSNICFPYFIIVIFVITIISRNSVIVCFIAQS